MPGSTVTTLPAGSTPRLASDGAQAGGLVHRQAHPVAQGVAEGLAVARGGDHLPGQGIAGQAVHAGLEFRLGPGLGPAHQGVNLPELLIRPAPG